MLSGRDRAVHAVLGMLCPACCARLEGGQQRAGALVAEEVRQVLVRLAAVLGVQAGQLEGDADAVRVPHRRHDVQPPALRATQPRLRAGARA